MKKILLITISIILILSSIPTFADENVIYNDGPEPHNPRYIHFTRVIYHTDNTGVKIDTSYEYYIYQNTNHPNEIAYLNVDYGPSNLVKDIKLRSSPSNPTTSFKTYSRAGVNTEFEQITFHRIYNVSVAQYTYSNPQARITLEEVLEGINDGYIFQSANYYDQTYQITHIYHDIQMPIYTNSSLEEIAIYPKAPSLPDYDDEGFIKILQPLNNFKQSGSIPYWSIHLFYQVPVNESSSVKDWVITPISDTIKGINVDTHNINEIGIYPFNYYQGYMTATYSVPYGENLIAFKIQNKVTGKYYLTNYYTYHNLEGFIDDNEDGIDDRTGLPDLGYIPDEWLNDGLPSNGYLPIEEWSFTNIFSNIGILLNNFYIAISSLLTQIGEMLSIFGVLNSLIPPEIVAILTSSILLLIILKVFHR